jgi:hypothetical protein
MENTFRVEYFSHDDADFTVVIYFNTAEQMDAIVELVSLCPVTNLQISDDVDI